MVRSLSVLLLADQLVTFAVNSGGTRGCMEEWLQTYAQLCGGFLNQRNVANAA